MNDVVRCCVTLSDAADGDNEKDEDVLDVSTPRSKPQQVVLCSFVLLSIDTRTFY